MACAPQSRRNREMSRVRRRALTRSSKAHNLVVMRFGKAILLVSLAVALAAYVFDCDAMSTPEQAMNCCHTMPCASHGHHGQECCKSMSEIHAPFVAPPAGRGISSTPLLFAVLPSPQIGGRNFSGLSTAADFHAPPIFSPPLRPPLRI